MKHTTNNSENTMNKNANQKQAIKNKKVEVNTRRRINKSWQEIEDTPRYRSMSARKTCDITNRKIEIEVPDGILLNLNVRNQTKPTSVQYRILRRIVEKRQAQANHKKYGHTEELTSIHISISTKNRCMQAVHKKRLAA